MTVRGGAIINIAGNTPVEDPEYRYKMPAVFGKIEGSGNGIKTNIPNISDVALSLHRSPAEVNKFFGCELGAQTTYSPETDRAIVNGAHTDAVLQSLMHRYIENFVLCTNCRLPETDYKIKNDAIFQKCAACGAKEIVDMNHKLCTFILAQDKKAKKEAKKGEGKSKDDKKKGKEDKKKEKKKDKEGSDEEKKKKKEKKGDKKDKKKDKGEKEDDKAYLKEAIFGKEENSDELGVDNDDSESVDSQAGVDDEGALKLAVEGTRKFLLDNPSASADEIVEVVTNQQMASALKAHEKIHILVQAAITPHFFKNQDISKYAPAFAKIANGNSIIERHLIASLEAVCVDKPKNFPVMLKQFYDEDVLEEDTILAWAEEGRNEYTLDVVDEETRAALRGAAEPVVVWLQKPDSDDEDDEE